MCFSVAAINGDDAGGHVVTSSQPARPEVDRGGIASPTRPALTVTPSGGMKSPLVAGDPLLSAYRTPSPLLGLTYFHTRAKNIKHSVLVHGQVTIIFVVSVCLFVCLFVCAEFFSAVFDPNSIKLGHMLYVWV